MKQTPLLQRAGSLRRMHGGDRVSGGSAIGRYEVEEDDVGSRKPGHLRNALFTLVIFFLGLVAFVFIIAPLEEGAEGTSLTAPIDQALTELVQLEKIGLRGIVGQLREHTNDEQKRDEKVENNEEIYGGREGGNDRNTGSRGKKGTEVTEGATLSFESLNGFECVMFMLSHHTPIHIERSISLLHA